MATNIARQTRQPPALGASVEHCAFAVQEIRALDETTDGWGQARPWFEVLIRPHRSVYPGSPASFIDRLYRERPVHETDGEIVERVVRWLINRRQPTRVSVNVHPESLTRQKFVDNILSSQPMIERNGHSLCLELIEFGDCSERLVMIANARRLRAAGIPIALDDFGSRVNCFDLCAAGIVDVLKIDTSVISHLHEDCNQGAVIDSIGTLGRGLGATVVAEGVEIREQVEGLIDLGIEFAQGYYFHKPEIVDI